MYSIKFDKKIVKRLKFIDVETLLPHEDVIKEKKELLINYINSFNDHVIISSIICCSKTMVIIDGHHRYFALKELGHKKIPVTMIDYFSDEIKTDFKEKIAKQEIIDYAKNKKFIRPKSTKHIVFCQESKQWEPIILLSSLCKVVTN